MPRKPPEPIARKPVSILPAERFIIDALKLYTPSDEKQPPLIELSDLLKTVSTRVKDTGITGKVIMEITLAGKGQNLEMSVHCAKKMPESKPAKRLVFATDEGEIVGHNPDQYVFADMLNQSMPEAEKAAS